METLELVPDVSSAVNQFWGAPDEALFPPPVLVALTGLSAAYFERARWSGDGPKFMKIGSRVRYRKSDVCAWLKLGESAESTSQVVPIPALAARRAAPAQGPGKRRGRRKARPAETAAA